MKRLLFLAGLMVVVGVIYLSYLNPSSITFNLSPTLSYQLPLMILVLLSLIVGALLMSLFDLIKGGGDLWDLWRRKRRERRQSELTELLNKARVYLNDRNLGEAKRVLAEVLKKEPQHLDALYQWGLISLEEGDHQGAISQLLKARILAYQEPHYKREILNKLGEAYLGCGNLREAISVYQELRGLSGDSYEPLRKLRYLYMETHDWDEAYQVQRELTSLRKRRRARGQEEDLTSVIFYEMGRSFIQGKEYRKAIAKLREAIKFDPQFVPAYMTLGEVYLQLNRPQEALRIWDKGYEATGSALFLKRQEQYFYRSEMPSKIIDRYRKAIQDDPSKTELYLLLADAYLQLEMPDEALAELMKIGEQNSLDSPLYYHSLAKIYEKKGDWKGALETLKLALNQDDFSLQSYRCKECGQQMEEWSARCPRCRKWNTVDVGIF